MNESTFLGTYVNEVKHSNGLEDVDDVGRMTEVESSGSLQDL